MNLLLVDDEIVSIKGIQKGVNWELLPFEQVFTATNALIAKNILKKERTDSKGIGVKNVNDRIKIYFGNNYGIVVESELDVGTTITIKIPAVMEDRYSV